MRILEISSSDTETLLEEGRIDVGLGWVTRHSPELHYEHLGSDPFTAVVAPTHPWAKRRVTDLSELHLQRVVQLPDSYVMRRMTDEMFRSYRIRPRTVAEINSIEMLLRSLAPLGAIGLMPRVSLRGTEHLDLRTIRLQGKSLGLEIGVLRLLESGANPVVAAFTELAKTLVPRMIEEASSSTRGTRNR